MRSPPVCSFFLYLCLILLGLVPGVSGVQGSVLMVYNNCGPGAVCDGSAGHGRWGCSNKVVLVPCETVVQTILSY